MESLLDAFTRHFVTLGKSQHTIRKYRKDLRLFFRTQGVARVSDITRDRINDWVYALRTKGRSTGYIANHLWAIKAFLKFLSAEKKMSCYEFDIKIPRVPAPNIVEYLEPEELEQIFAVINHHDICGLRLRTLIEVMINTGMRPHEALALRRPDIRHDELEIVGKGGKHRKIYINDRVRQWANRYLGMRRDPHEALFISHRPYSRGPALSLRQAEHHFQFHVQKSGIRKRVVLHTLRHTYATTLLANGCPIDYVALLLGHAKPETTRRHYVSIQHKHAKGAHFRYLSYDVDQETGESPPTV